jgi:hypothetical protein
MCMGPKPKVKNSARRKGKAGAEPHAPHGRYGPVQLYIRGSRGDFAIGLYQSALRCHGHLLWDATGPVRPYAHQHGHPGPGDADPSPRPRRRTSVAISPLPFVVVGCGGGFTPPPPLPLPTQNTCAVLYARCCLGTNNGLCALRGYGH